MNATIGIKDFLNRTGFGYMANVTTQYDSFMYDSVVKYCGSNLTGVTRDSFFHPDEVMSLAYVVYLFALLVPFVLVLLHRFTRHFTPKYFQSIHKLLAYFTPEQVRHGMLEV